MAMNDFPDGEPPPRRGLSARAVLSALGLAGLAVLALVRPLAAQEAEPYYRGKQIRLVVGSSPGGGYDSYARLLAPHLARHIPGQPTVIVQNMPGAGSLVLANHLANIAPKDGTVIGAVNPLVATQPLFFPDRARFDSRRMRWIGSVLRETHVGFAWHDSPVKAFDDVFRQELIVAGSGGSTNSVPTAVNAVLGTRFKVISGYAGTKEGLLALERGEVGGIVGITWASLKASSGAWLRENKVRLLAQFALERHPELPDVPWVFDRVTNEDDRAALRLVFTTQEFGRPYLVGPGVPDEVVAILRRAFDATVRDAEFLADAGRRKLDIEPTSGAEIQSLVEAIYATPAPVTERVKVFLGEQIQ